ncbi:MAG: methyltransferase domain-containing protein [Phycisphaerae bacterium]|nr:methyltransferase domain-containing protein [Phycisphaerae bacterium]
MSTLSTRIFVSIAVLTFCLPALGQPSAEPRTSVAGYGLREAGETVIKRLGLRPDSVVVDIGAGDGWWASLMAAKMGPEGVIHAGEVDQKKVAALQKKWADVSQIKPYLCPLDGTGLGADSCDVAFLSKTYHHLDRHVDYLKHLKDVVKPAGRLVVIERHTALSSRRGAEHAWLPGLLAMQAEEAGWMLLRCEMLPDSDHFIAVFVQPDAFAEKLAKQRQNH